MRPEDVGDKGEAFFKLLCKDAGYVANRADDDKKGWDYEVEHRSSSLISYSDQSCPVYRIQVKATSTTKPSVPVSYSNLLNLIRYSGASFIFLAMFSEAPLPYTAYLFHIDEQFSKKILEEVRKKQLKSSKFSLDRVRVVTFQDQHKVESLDGQGLKKAFERYVGDYLKYVEQKVALLKQLEKEGRAKIATFTLRSDSDLQALVECCLGYDEKFTAQVDLYRAPYGFRDAEPYDIVAEHRTTITPVHEQRPKVALCLKTSKFGKSFKFSGIVYTLPEGFPASEEGPRMRIKTLLFDLLFTYESAGVRPGIVLADIFEAGVFVELKVWYDFFCFLKESRHGGKTYLRIEGESGQEPLEICLGVSTWELPRDFEILFDALHATYLKCRELNLDDEIILTSSILGQFGHFHLLDIVGKSYDPEYELGFESSEDYDLDANVVVFRSHIKFKDTTVTFFSAFFGRIERIEGNNFRGFFDRSELLGELIFDNLVDAEGVVKNEQENYRQKLAKQGLRVF